MRRLIRADIRRILKKRSVIVLFLLTLLYVPGIILGIDEDRFAVLIGHGVDGGVKSRITAENLLLSS